MTLAAAPQLPPALDPEVPYDQLTDVDAKLDRLRHVLYHALRDINTAMLAGGTGIGMPAHVTRWGQHLLTTAAERRMLSRGEPL